MPALPGFNSLLSLDRFAGTLHLLGSLMDWLSLLSDQRLGQRPSEGQARRRTPFQIDYDRIIFSSAFRRLQDKTQVFPLATSDFVRTRLTHTLEVSCVARSLGELAGKEICARHGLPGMHESDIAAICAAAALAHDLGNPPFGHSGEDAIRHWFETSETAASIRNDLSPAQIADISRYEGNAQAFRVVTTLQMPERDGGMQLTCAALGALAKYPIESILAVSPGKPPGASGKKFNFFQSEKRWFEQVAEVTGLIRRRPDAAWWCRHPLAFLVEAADDICYNIIDFEDAYRHGLMSYDEVRTRFSGIIAWPKIDSFLDRFSDPGNQISSLRAMAINKLVEECASVFLENEAALLEGTFDQPLTDFMPSASLFKEIQDRSYSDIYSNREVVGIEVAGFEVIGGLLEVFAHAANEVAANGSGASARSKKTLRMVPQQFLGSKGTVDPDPYLRIMRLLDYIAGMTDSYAVTLYKKIRGISL